MIAFLAFSDWGWAIVTILQFIWKLRFFSTFSLLPCVLLRVLWQYFSTSSVYWTAIISYNIQINLKRTIEGKPKTRYFYQLALINKNNQVPVDAYDFYRKRIAYHMDSCASYSEICCAEPGYFFPQYLDKVVDLNCYPKQPWRFIFFFLPNLGGFIYTIVNSFLIIHRFGSLTTAFWSRLKTKGIITLPIHAR